MTQNNMEVVAWAYEYRDRKDTAWHEVSSLTRVESGSFNKDWVRNVQPLVTLTSAQAEIERLTKERDEALLCQQEIAAGTSKSATVARIIIAKNEAEARAEAAEKERDALREELSLTRADRDTFYHEATALALQPLEPKNGQ
jgi:hypothetical protein